MFLPIHLVYKVKLLLFYGMQVALHCFNNLVQFMTTHRFKTDWKSVAWRKSFLNICLSGIDALHVKKSHLSEIFNVDKRTLNEYTIDQADQHMQGLLGLTSNHQPKQTWLGIQACAWWRPAHIGGNKWPKRISMQPWWVLSHRRLNIYIPTHVPVHFFNIYLIAQVLVASRIKELSDHIL